MGHFSFLRPNLKSIEFRRKSLNYYDIPFSLPEISNTCCFFNFNSLRDTNIFLDLKKCPIQPQSGVEWEMGHTMIHNK
jgi:hypothetical protein